MTSRIANLLFLFALLLISPVRSGAQSATGCGPANFKFSVKTVLGNRATPIADPLKATVFFLQDDVRYGARPRPTTEFGIDGEWVGATHANSYFFVSVDPGEHHLCANWQSRVTKRVPTRPTSALHFTAEAGNTYYFRARDIAEGGDSSPPIEEVILEALDSDEARLLMRSFAHSVSEPKK